LQQNPFQVNTFIKELLHN